MKLHPVILTAALLSCSLQATTVLADPQAAPPSDATAAATATATDAGTKALPPPATSAAVPSAVAPAPSTMPAAANAPAVSEAPAAAVQAATPTGGANLTSELLEKHFKAEGYQVKKDRGQKVYCRVDTTTGSHIPREFCYTEDSLVRAESHDPSSSSTGTIGKMPPPPCSQVGPGGTVRGCSF